MDDFLKSRIRDLDRTAWERDVTKHTGFLTASEQSDLLAWERELSHPERFLAGGWEEAERRMLIWPASYEMLSSENDSAAKGTGRPDLPGQFISCIKASPVNAKFSDDLCHRDFLGALMNLGIERDQIGDILIRENTAYIFCAKALAGLILDELTRVKHTEIRTEAVPLSECDIRPELAEMKVNVASERLDAILSAVYKVSRSKAAEAIESEKVFVDGRTASGSGQKLKEGAKVSVRGLGKFIYDGIESESRKGRLFVKIRKYI